MGEHWFYIWNGQQTGPCTQDQLRGMIQAGKLPPENPVWREGLPNWSPINTIPEFAPFLPAYASTAQEQGQFQAQLPMGQTGPYPGQSFPQPGYASEQAENYEEERSAEKKRRKKEQKRAFKGQMRAASLGLGFLFWSIFLYLLSFVFGFLAWLSPVIVFAGLIASFLSSILFTAGSILCCFIPAKSRARPYMIVSVALVGASLLMMVAMFFIAFAVTASGTPGLSSQVGVLMLLLLGLMVISVLAAYVFFMLFLRVLATFLGEAGTASEVSDILWRWVAAVVLFIPGSLVAFGVTFVYAYAFSRLRGGIEIAGLLLGGVILVLFLAWLVFWLKQWFRLLQVIQSIKKTLKYEFRV